jgi:exosortase K
MQKMPYAISGQCAGVGQPVRSNAVAAYARTDAVPFGLTVLAMLLLKRHYSLATAEQLDWILMPTATLVSWFTSAHLVPEIGVGHVDFARGIIVAPACAGVNFMIMAFGLTAFYGLYHMRRLPGKLVWLPLALTAAYGLTLAVNTARIVLSMSLYDANIYTSWLTAARVHRLAGVSLYFSALWLYFVGLRHVVAIACKHFVGFRGDVSMHKTEFWVWGCYLVVALAMPLAHLAWQELPAAFGEHCATVLIACSALGALVSIMGRLLRGLYRSLSECFPMLSARVSWQVARAGKPFTGKELN